MWTATDKNDAVGAFSLDIVDLCAGTQIIPFDFATTAECTVGESVTLDFPSFEDTKAILLGG